MARVAAVPLRVPRTSRPAGDGGDVGDDDSEMKGVWRGYVNEGRVKGRAVDATVSENDGAAGGPGHHRGERHAFVML